MGGFILGVAALGGILWWLRSRALTAAGADVLACTNVYPDGPLRICLMRTTGGWGWRSWLEDPVIDAPDIPNDGEFSDGELYPSPGEAHVRAWGNLVMRVPDYGENVVVSLPLSRWGLTLNIDGVVTVDNVANYVNHASQLIATAQQSGDDAAGIVLTVLIDAFGTSWNPFRARIAGGSFADAVARLEAVPQNPPQQARAIMGLA